MTDREWRIWMLADTVGLSEARDRVDAVYSPGGSTSSSEAENDALSFFYGQQGAAGEAPEGAIVGDEAFIRASELAYGIGYRVLPTTVEQPPVETIPAVAEAA